ncbi:hypothetical protein LINGRAHAP2_LOCUS18194 [Linum grandiflorum]
MRELKANMAVLGKEASAALAAVEAQQQRLTFQRLVSLVEGEKNYHLRIGAIPLENGPLGSALLLSLCHDPRGDKKKYFIQDGFLVCTSFLTPVLYLQGVIPYGSQLGNFNFPCL